MAPELLIEKVSGEAGVETDATPTGSWVDPTWRESGIDPDRS
jgi:hypothetical protein